MLKMTQKVDPLNKMNISLVATVANTKFVCVYVLCTHLFNNRCQTAKC